jgi:hypothetical protein
VASAACSTLPGEAPKVPRLEKLTPPPNYGLEDCVDSQGKARVCVTEETIDYLIDLEIRTRKLEEAPCWEDP